MNLDEIKPELLIEARAEARKNKEFTTCDIIRNHLDEKLIFIFDTKDRQEIYYLTEGYFNKNDYNSEAMSKRQYVEKRIQRDIRANKNFDAWLFSMKNKIDSRSDS